MWASDNWKDYELIDCGRGEKLERWGDQLLVRPDPQAIWNTPRTHRGWKVNAGRYARSSTGGGQWQNKSMPERWTVSYGDLTFNIKPISWRPSSPNASAATLPVTSWGCPSPKAGWSSPVGPRGVGSSMRREVLRGKRSGRVPAVWWNNNRTKGGVKPHGYASISPLFALCSQLYPERAII